MKILDRHIVNEILPAFYLGVVLFAGFIWIAGGPLLAAVNYLARGVPLWIVLQIVGLYLPPMLVLSFPMAMLIAVIAGFTRFSADSEAVAVFATGTSFYRMLRPTAAVGAVVSIVGLIINNSVVPAATHQIDYFKRNVIHDVQQTSEPFNLPPLRYKDGKVQALAWVEGGYDQVRQQMKNVTIIEFDPATERPVATIYADAAQWQGGSNWQLINVQIQRAGTVLTAATLDTRDINQGPETIAFLEQSPDDLTFAQLSKQIDLLKRSGVRATDNLREAEVSMWEKIALPCASFIFAMVGAPLGLNPQRTPSRSAALGYGALIILSYYALFKYLDILGMHGRIDPFAAAFLPNVLGIILAGWLISRATT